MEILCCLPVACTIAHWPTYDVRDLYLAWLTGSRVGRHRASLLRLFPWFYLLDSISLASLCKKGAIWVHAFMHMPLCVWIMSGRLCVYVIAPLCMCYEKHRWVVTVLLHQYTHIFKMFRKLVFFSITLKHTHTTHTHTQLVLKNVILRCRQEHSVWSQ